MEEENNMNLLKFINQRAKDMFKYPKAYAGSSEAFELQLLLLLEFQANITSNLKLQENPRLVIELYTSKILKKFPKYSGLYLSSMVKIEPSIDFLKEVGLIFYAVMEDLRKIN